MSHMTCHYCGRHTHELFSDGCHSVCIHCLHDMDPQSARELQADCGADMDRAYDSMRDEQAMQSMKGGK